MFLAAVAVMESPGSPTLELLPRDSREGNRDSRGRERGVVGTEEDIGAALLLDTVDALRLERKSFARANMFVVQTFLVIRCYLVTFPSDSTLFGDCGNFFGEYMLFDCWANFLGDSMLFGACANFFSSVMLFSVCASFFGDSVLFGACASFLGDSTLFGACANFFVGSILFGDCANFLGDYMFFKECANFGDSMLFGDWANFFGSVMFFRLSN